jgi:hypothetical protein
MLLTLILRTLVPALWGSLIAWLIGIAPLLAPLEAHLLGVPDIILPIHHRRHYRRLVRALAMPETPPGRLAHPSRPRIRADTQVPGKARNLIRNAPPHSWGGRSVR